MQGSVQNHDNHSRTGSSFKRFFLRHNPPRPIATNTGVSTPPTSPPCSGRVCGGKLNKPTQAGARMGHGNDTLHSCIRYVKMYVNRTSKQLKRVAHNI